MELSAEPKSKYNELERKLFDAIPKNGDRINLKQLLLVRLNHNPKWDVLHPRNILSTVMIRLAAKIEKNGEPFALVREGIRRQEVWYSVEPRNRQRTRRSSPVGITRMSLFD